MAYADFSLQTAIDRLGLEARSAVLFPKLQPCVVPDWLPTVLARGSHNPLLNETTRSQMIVTPVLLAAQEITGNAFTIFPGVSLNVRPADGLNGECDYVLSASPPLPMLRAPILTLVEAKNADIDSGLGQCAAQMVGARVFNEQAGHAGRAVYGCVTTGEVWAFLKLGESVLTLDQSRFYISDVADILSAIRSVVDELR
jgi:hypothetical protein